MGYKALEMRQFEAARRPSGRMGLWRLVASVVLLGASASVAWAQSASVHGRVTDAVTGQAIQGAQIEVDASGLSSRTDSAGRFRVDGVVVGRRTVRVTAVGYTDRVEVVQLSAGEVRELRIELEPAPIGLPALTVVLDRTRLVGDASQLFSAVGSAHLLTLVESGDRNAFSDVHQVLRQVPGVVVQEEDGYGLRPNIGMRGTGQDRSAKITVMEDGVLIAPAPYSAPAAYHFPTVGRMEAVEVRKGSSQVKYGPQTIGGALNLVSSTIPETSMLRVDADGGSGGMWKVRARAGDSGSNFGWLVETYRVETDGFKELDTGGDTGFQVADHLIKLRYHTDPAARNHHAVELKLGLTDHVSDETYLGLTDEDFARTPLRRYAGSQVDVMESEHRQLQLRHIFRAGDRVDVTTVLYRNEFERNWYKLASVGGRGIAAVLEDPATYADEFAILQGASSASGALVVRANDRGYHSQGVQSILGSRIVAGPTSHQVEVGVRYHEDGEDRFQHDDLYEMDGGRMRLTSAGVPGSQANRIGEATAWAAFVQDRIVFGDWTVVPGVRYESIAFTRTDYATDDPDRTLPTGVRETTVTAWIPGVGLSRAFGEDWSVFAGVHRGFGPPGPGAAEETRPEESTSYELGVRYRWGGVQAQLVGFANRYRNILGRATLSGGANEAGDIYNGGRVDVSGVEAFVDGAVEAGAGMVVPVRVAYTYTHAEFRSSFESAYTPWGTVREGDRLPYLPEHQLTASTGLEGDSWRLGVSASYTAEARTVAGRGAIPEGRSTDAALVFSADASWSVASWASLVASAQNLTDERYIVSRLPAGARPGLPRTVTVGLRLAR